MNEREWKKMNSKKIFGHPRLSVYEDTIKLPNGTTTTYIHFGEVPDSVAVIAIRHDGKILLQQEYSYPPNEWLYQFPGGSVEPGESPLASAQRELAEEAGLSGSLTGIGWFYQDNRRKKARQHVFVAKDLKINKGIKDVEEAFKDLWVSLEKINELIRSGKIVNYSLLAAWSIFRTRF